MLRLRFFLLATAIIPSSISAQLKPSQPGKQIIGRGCVEPGVEAKCLVVRDAKSNVLYNPIFDSGNEPQVGAAIRFEGTPHQGPTTCMQGTAVKVTKWTPIQMKCEKPKDPQ